MTWKAEDGARVVGRVCGGCPFVGSDKADPEFVRDWFENPTSAQESRVHCHEEGGSYHPATEDDRACRGFYLSAKKLGVFDPGSDEQNTDPEGKQSDSKASGSVGAGFSPPAPLTSPAAAVTHHGMGAAPGVCQSPAPDCSGYHSQADPGGGDAQ